MDSQEIRQINCYVIVSFVRISQGFVRNSQAFVTMCKASLVSVIILANRIVFGEFAANIKFLHSQGYSPLCRISRVALEEVERYFALPIDT